MRIITDPKLDFEDCLIVPKRSTLLSRRDVDLVREFVFPHSDVKYKAVPIIAANMDHTGTFEMFDALSEHGVSVALHKHYSLEELVGRYVSCAFRNKLQVPAFYSMGISSQEYQKFIEFCELKGSIPKYINIDVANGYSVQFANYVKKVRELVGKSSVIMAGNVVTSDMTQELILSGADIVKIGIGPGSVCTTRKITGVGYPQLSAVIECADAAHGLQGLVCADGGCKVPGDVAKAFVAGADFVMLGGMFAGHTECSGEVINKTFTTDEIRTDADGNLTPHFKLKKYKKFYGMSSDVAMDQYSGGVADYRASEGKVVEVEFKGSVHETIKEILGGVRSTCTYVGARKLKQLSKCGSFIMVNRQLNNKFSSD